jgi:hypothetical protein
MVIREDFGQTARGGTARWEAAWIARAEKGRFAKSIVLADVKIEATQMQMIKRFLDRRDSLPLQRQNGMENRAALLKAMGKTRRSGDTIDRYLVCERVLSDILNRANAANRPMQRPRVTLPIPSVSNGPLTAKLQISQEWRRDSATPQSSGSNHRKLSSTVAISHAPVLGQTRFSCAV